MGKTKPKGGVETVAETDATPSTIRQALLRPIAGGERARVLEYDTEIERDGKVVEAHVTEVDSRKLAVGPIGGALVGLAALGVVGAAVSGASEAAKRRQAIREASK